VHSRCHLIHGDLEVALIQRGEVVYQGAEPNELILDHCIVNNIGGNLKLLELTAGMKT
jgi:hypothetical protein